MSALGWFRTDCTCLSAPEVTRLSRALNIPTAHALGIITAIEAQLAAYAPSGDLSDVADMLATWAQWDGDRDAFVREFMRAAANTDGIMVGWLNRNADAMNHINSNRERQRRFRAKRKSERSGGDQ